MRIFHVTHHVARDCGILLENPQEFGLDLNYILCIGTS